MMHFFTKSNLAQIERWQKKSALLKWLNIWYVSLQESGRSIWLWI